MRAGMKCDDFIGILNATSSNPDITYQLESSPTG